MSLSDGNELMELCRVPKTTFPLLTALLLAPLTGLSAVAGPFKAHLGDGSVVTCYWYRFADQPAMLNADLTPAEREVVQKRVELLHRAWTKDRNYLAPPDAGALAHLDPALILTPPRGMEAGYVPIATRQELVGAAIHPNDQEKARQ
jgi:hypothetical protein